MKAAKIAASCVIIAYKDASVDKLICLEMNSIRMIVILEINEFYCILADRFCKVYS